MRNSIGSLYTDYVSIMFFFHVKLNAIDYVYKNITDQSNTITILTDQVETLTSVKAKQ
jgi:hypothetical protein